MMTPSKLRATVVSERIHWVRQMVTQISALPLDSFENFTRDEHVPAAAESYLRRGLEALLDLGRHFLAKGFGFAPAEYKEIARELVRVGVITEAEAQLLSMMAGYRNRMVHFYHEVSTAELYEICTAHLADIDQVLTALESWIRRNPDKIDTTL